MYDQTVVSQSTQNTYQEYVFTIAPGERMAPIHFAFNYFRILTMSGNGPLFVTFGDNSQETHFAGTGIGYQAPFVMPRVVLRNGGASPLTVRLALGIGEITDDRVNFDTSAVLPNRQVQASVAGAYAVPVDVTPFLILAADPDRLWATITPLDGDIFVGNITVAANSGLKISAGSSYSLDLTGDLYAVTLSGTVDVRVMEGFL